jgi:hypothetical protein
MSRVTSRAIFRWVRRLLAAAIVLALVYFLIVHPRARHEDSRGNYPQERGRPHPPAETPPHRQGHDREPAPEVGCASQYFASWHEPREGACTVRVRNGYPIPDPRCTPGGVNPTITDDVLHNPAWRTREVRNCAESEAQKHEAYRWYRIVKPRINSNENQFCELDHLVPLELGGADGMGNIWPQCGPDAVTLNQRYFKEKDHVENYLAYQVKAGQIPLPEAQRGIAHDWTQYLNDADLWCGRTGRC